MKKTFENVRKLLETRDYEKALKILKEARSDKEDQAEAYRMLGYVYYQMRDFDASIENSTKSINLGNLGFMETNMAHYFRGRAAADSLNYDLAISDSWTLLKFAETDSDSLDDAYDIIEIILNSDFSKVCSQTKLRLEELLLQALKLENARSKNLPLETSSLLDKLRLQL